MHVDRHASISNDRPTEALDRVERAQAVAMMHPGMLAQLVDDAYAVADRGDGGVETRRALHVGAGAGAALFQLASGAGEARLLRKVVRSDGIDLGETATAERWIRAFHLATAVGDLSALRTLAKVGAVAGEPAYARWKDAIQAWGRAEPSWTRTLGDARELLSALGPRARALDVPLLDCALALEEGGFPDALVRALEAHRSFHEGGPDGAIAVGPLAFAALATIRGTDVGVTSDYLPAGLLPPQKQVRTRGDDESLALADELAPILASLVGKTGGAALLALRPRDEDWDEVFASGADRAKQGYEAFWADPPRISVPADRTQVTVLRATTEDLAEGRGRAQDFPGGWRKIAPMLRPGLTWVAWRHHRPGERLGTSFDGLVKVGDHWAWFPRPWRALE